VRHARSGDSRRQPGHAQGDSCPRHRRWRSRGGGMTGSREIAAWVAAAAMIVGGQSLASAKDKSSAPAKDKDKSTAAAAAASAENYDEQFAKYLQEARTPPARPADAWSWMGNLALDPRARQVNDLITIRVVESITAS